MQQSQMVGTFAILAVVAAAVSAYPGYDLGGGYGHQSIDEYAYPKYKFDYAVYDPHSGDIKNQWESRDGDIVKGSYSLKEADGSTRVVEYSADKHNGFVAVVKRAGGYAKPEITYHGVKRY